MVAFGYTLMCEQRGPRELVSDAVAAEQAGFDFEVISDHYFPWLDAQGHAPNAWAVLGAVATATRRVPLMTYVTCPIMRYHPAVVAQQAATVALLAGDDRFVLGLGAGENLNEHVVGRGWPPANVRHEMLTEAVEIISRLFERRLREHGPGSTTASTPRSCGTCRQSRVPIAVAVSGSQSVETFAPIADAMVAVEPEPSLVTGFDDAAGVQVPKIGQQPHLLGARPRRRRGDRARPVPLVRGWVEGQRRAAGHLRVRGGDAVRAARRRRRGDPLRAGRRGAVEAVRPFVDAGFTHVALVQIGGQTQAEFVSFAARELLPALREEYGKPDDVAVHAR